MLIVYDRNEGRSLNVLKTIKQLLMHTKLQWSCLVYVHQANRTDNGSQHKHSTTSIYKHKVGWLPHPSSTVEPSTPTTPETTTRIRVTNEQLRRLLEGDFSTTPSPIERGLPKRLVWKNKFVIFPIFRKQTVTLVTALLDIGRGRWPSYSRPLSRYHFAMKNVLSMRVPMWVLKC